MPGKAGTLGLSTNCRIYELTNYSKRTQLCKRRRIRQFGNSKIRKSTVIYLNNSCAHSALRIDPGLRRPALFADPARRHSAVETHPGGRTWRRRIRWTRITRTWEEASSAE